MTLCQEDSSGQQAFAISHQGELCRRYLRYPAHRKSSARCSSRVQIREVMLPGHPRLV